MKTLISISLFLLLVSCSQNKDYFTKEEEVFMGSTTAASLKKYVSKVPVECKNIDAKPSIESLNGFISVMKNLSYCPTSGTLRKNLYAQTKNCITRTLKSLNSKLQPVSETCRKTTKNIVTNVLKDSIRVYHLNKVVPNNYEEYNYNNLRKYYSLVDIFFRSQSNKLLFSSLFEKTNYIRNNLISILLEDIPKYSKDWLIMTGMIRSFDTSNTSQIQEGIDSKKVEKNLAHFNTFNAMMCISIKRLNASLPDPTTLLSCGENFEWSFEKNLKVQLSPEIFAMIIEPILRSLNERTNIISKIYDIACNIKDCSDMEFPKNTNLHKYYNFFSDPTNNLTKSYKKTSRPTEWFLQVISTENNASAIDQLKKKSNMLKTDSDDFTTSLYSLNNFFETSTIKISNYKETKFYSGRTKRSMLTGFDKKSFQARMLTVKTRVASFENRLNTLKNVKLNLMQKIINSNNNISLENELVNRLSSILNEITLLSNKIGSNMAEVTSERITIDKNLKSLLERHSVKKECKTLGCISSETNWSNSDEFIVTEQKTMKISSSTLKFKKGILRNNIKNISQLINNDQEPFKIDAEADAPQFIYFDIKGQWSPTCAIGNSYPNISNAKIGPSGFLSSYAEASNHTISENKYMTKEKFMTYSASSTHCLNFKTPGEAVYGVSASNQNCATVQGGNTKSDINSDSFTDNIQFNLGLRHKDTPFPSFPAGSILAVLVPSGSRSLNFDEIEVQQLNRNSTMLVDSNKDLYIVGNDCTGDDTNELTINIKKSMAQSKQAKSIALTFMNVIKKVGKKYEKLADSGIFTQDDANVFKNKVLSSSFFDINIDSLGKFKKLFESWIDYKISILRRKTQIFALNKELDILNRSFNITVKKLFNARVNNKINNRVRTELLSSLDIDLLNSSTSDNENLETLNYLISSIENIALTVINFKYDNLKDQLINNIETLKGINLGDNYLDLGKKIFGFFNTLTLKIDEIEQFLPSESHQTVAVVIPNPYCKNPDNCNLVDFQDYNIINDGRAQVFWDKLLAWKKKYSKENKKEYIHYQPSIKITPNDLYNNINTETYGLTCKTLAPIISNAGLYFLNLRETDNSILEYESKHADVKIDGSFNIPFYEGPREYDFLLNQWRHTTFKVQMIGSIEKAKQDISSYRNNTTTHFGKGRSPFGTFRFMDQSIVRRGAINRVKIKGNDIPAAVLVFDLLPTSKLYGKDLSKWIKNCRESDD